MLNEKARAVYDYIKTRADHGIPPTVREICTALGLKSTSTAHRYINILVNAGYLEKIGNQNRAIRIKGKHTMLVPLLQSLTADTALTAPDNVTDYISYGTEDAVSAPLFAWRMQTPAKDAALGILADDIVIVAPHAENVPLPEQALLLTGQAEQIAILRLPEAAALHIYGTVLAVIRNMPYSTGLLVSSAALC